MASLIKGVEEQGWRARSERRISQGRCVSVDTLLHSCVLDVGEYDATGAPVLLRDVPFSPQSPPSVGDLVPLSYFNSSPHSIRVAAGQLSGQNSQGTVTTNGGVNSVAAGAGAKIKGDVTLAAGTNISLAEAGQIITITATGSAGGVTSVNGDTGAVNFTTALGGLAITAGPAAGQINLEATANFVQELAAGVGVQNQTIGTLVTIAVLPGESLSFAGAPGGSNTIFVLNQTGASLTIPCGSVNVYGDGTTSTTLAAGKAAMFSSAKKTGGGFTIYRSDFA